jgi:energy-converting hydrogenase Eha subunit H
MTAELYQNIVIAFSVVWTIGLVLLLIMVFSLYRKTSAVQTSITGTINEIKKAVAETKEVIKPMMQIVAILDAVRSGIDVVSKISGIKKGGKEDE